MSGVSDGGHRTSSIPRPYGAAPRRAATTTTTRRRSDLTRAIPREDQLVRRRPSRWILGIVAVLITIALGAAVFVLPVRAWMNQRDDLTRYEDQLAVLDDANAQLSAEVERLQTPEGVAEAARQELGYVEPGESRLVLTEIPPAPGLLPGGWTYGLVSAIVAARAADVALSPAPPASATP
jgi:cell division protein FtsB